MLDAAVDEEAVEADADPHAAKRIVAAATPIDVVAVRDFRFTFRIARNIVKNDRALAYPASLLALYLLEIYKKESGN